MFLYLACLVPSNYSYIAPNIWTCCICIHLSGLLLMAAVVLWLLSVALVLVVRVALRICTCISTWNAEHPCSCWIALSTCACICTFGWICIEWTVMHAHILSPCHLHKRSMLCLSCWATASQVQVQYICAIALLEHSTVFDRQELWDMRDFARSEAARLLIATCFNWYWHAHLTNKWYKLASPEATLVRNHEPLSQLLTGANCWATGVAKIWQKREIYCLPLYGYLPQPSLLLGWILKFEKRESEDICIYPDTSSCKLSDIKVKVNCKVSKDICRILLTNLGP